MVKKTIKAWYLKGYPIFSDDDSGFLLKGNYESIFDEDTAVLGDIIDVCRVSPDSDVFYVQAVQDSDVSSESILYQIRLQNFGLLHNITADDVEELQEYADELARSERAWKNNADFMWLLNWVLERMKEGERAVREKWAEMGSTEEVSLAEGTDVPSSMLSRSEINQIFQEQSCIPDFSANSKNIKNLRTFLSYSQNGDGPQTLDAVMLEDMINNDQENPFQPGIPDGETVYAFKHRMKGR